MAKQGRKQLAFEGSSLADLRKWPEAARKEAGYQLDRVQAGLAPNDWKPFKTVGAGVREIRIMVDRNQYRVIYVQIIQHTVHVLHCFQKKTQKTSKRDVQLAQQRYKELATRSRR